MQQRIQERNQNENEGGEEEANSNFHCCCAKYWILLIMASVDKLQTLLNK